MDGRQGFGGRVPVAGSPLTCSRPPRGHGGQGPRGESVFLTLPGPTPGPAVTSCHGLAHQTSSPGWVALGLTFYPFPTGLTRGDLRCKQSD